MKLDVCILLLPSILFRITTNNLNIMRFNTKFHFLLLVMIFVLAGCSEGNQSATPPTAIDYSLTIEATEISTNKIEINVSTNVPGTIEVMASVNLSGQAPEDTYIGKSEKVMVAGGQGKTTIDVRELPSGQYEADVTFYPFWGFKDAQSKSTGISENLSVSQLIALRGSGESTESVTTRNKNQLWIMESMYIGSSWNSAEVKERLGSWTELPVTTRNPEIIKNYYFPTVDMTIVVNVLKGQVATFRKGKDGL